MTIQTSMFRSSSVGRVVVCPASEALLHTHYDKSPGVQEAADHGTMVHHWAATGEIVSPPGRPGWGDKLEARIRLFTSDPADWREKLWPTVDAVGKECGWHEQTLAIDLVTPGRYALFRGTKDQVGAWHEGLLAADPAPVKRWVKGEADYVGALLGEPWVDDLKTGRYADPRSEQHATYALGWLLSFPPRDRPDRVVTSVTHWPRSPLRAPPERLFAEFTKAELTAWYKTLHATRETVLQLRRRPEPDVQRATQPGPHCMYCPAKTNCRALTETPY